MGTSQISRQLSRETPWGVHFLEAPSQVASLASQVEEAQKQARAIEHSR